MPNPDVKAALPGFIRREVERAIDDAVNPKGMSVNDGKARIGADKLVYMLKVIDALAAADSAPAPVASLPFGQYLFYTALVENPAVERGARLNEQNAAAQEPKALATEGGIPPVAAAPALQEREAFERWFYGNKSECTAWEVWQARAALSEKGKP